MVILFKGSMYGSSSSYPPSVRGRYRQAHHDFGSDINEHYVRVDNVASNVGAKHSSVIAALISKLQKQFALSYLKTVARGYSAGHPVNCLWAAFAL